MRNCLRIAVSLSVLFGTHASFAQEAAENSWKPTQTIAREKEEGWQEAVLSTVEDIDEFGEDYKVYKDPKAKPTARARSNDEHSRPNRPLRRFRERDI